MFIIDFHTHCFPDSLAERALATLGEKASTPYFHSGTAAALDSFERKGGCDGYVVLSIATNPKQTSSVNRFAAQVQDTDRYIYSFGSVHPLNSDYKEHIKEIMEYGLRGIKFHPEYQEFHVNDKSMFPIYDEIFSNGLPVIFHAGEDIGFRPPWHAEPYKIAEVARSYPQATIIAAHMGGYNMWKEAGRELAFLPNVYADISFSAGRMPVEDFISACKMWPCDRLLFGTDSPWHTVDKTINAVNQLPISTQDKELIFSINALRILS